MKEKFKIVCGHCGKKFISDAETLYEDKNFPPFNGELFSFVCPYCKKENHVRHHLHYVDHLRKTVISFSPSTDELAYEHARMKRGIEILEGTTGYSYYRTDVLYELYNAILCLIYSYPDYFKTMVMETAYLLEFYEKYKEKYHFAENDIYHMRVMTVADPNNESQLLFEVDDDKIYEETIVYDPDRKNDYYDALIGLAREIDPSCLNQDFRNKLIRLFREKKKDITFEKGIEFLVYFIRSMDGGEIFSAITNCYWLKDFKAGDWVYVADSSNILFEGDIVMVEKYNGLSYPLKGEAGTNWIISHKADQPCPVPIPLDKKEPDDYFLVNELRCFAASHKWSWLPSNWLYSTFVYLYPEDKNKPIFGERFSGQLSHDGTYILAYLTRKKNETVKPQEYRIKDLIAYLCHSQSIRGIELAYQHQRICLDQYTIAYIMTSRIVTHPDSLSRLMQLMSENEKRECFYHDGYYYDDPGQTASALTALDGFDFELFRILSRIIFRKFIEHPELDIFTPEGSSRDEVYGVFFPKRYLDYIAHCAFLAHFENREPTAEEILSHFNVYYLSDFVLFPLDQSERIMMREAHGLYCDKLTPEQIAEKHKMTPEEVRDKLDHLEKISSERWETMKSYIRKNQSKKDT